MYEWRAELLDWQRMHSNQKKWISGGYCRCDSRIHSISTLSFSTSISTFPYNIHTNIHHAKIN